MERYSSGRRGCPAKALVRQNRSAGSNPALSAIGVSILTVWWYWDFFINPDNFGIYINFYILKNTSPSPKTYNIFNKIANIKTKHFAWSFFININFRFSFLLQQNILLNKKPWYPYSYLLLPYLLNTFLNQLS